MPFTGPPGEEEAERRASLKRFESFYGTNADARALYIAQPNNWIRFSIVFPRIAFLLKSVWFIYQRIDALLDIQYREEQVDEPRELNRMPILRFEHLDPFAYFDYEDVLFNQRKAFLNLRSALDKWSDGPTGPLFREIAHDILQLRCEDDRKLLLEELNSEAIAATLNSVDAYADGDIWRIRRNVNSREAMFETNFKRIERALNEHQMSRQDVVEYGTEPVAKSAKFVSPDRARQFSPQERVRGRLRPTHDRSPSRDTMASSRRPPSSIGRTTWAPEEPGLFELSMKVWSAKKACYIDTIGVMDTGCEGGNFVSSIFLAKHLEMLEHVVEDPEADHVQWVDFGGTKDFKPKDKVLLKWYARHLQNGRKGTRAPECSSWFRVAPHIDSDSGEQPFDILLGKEFLHENGVVQYRGLRLFKSKLKESTEQRQQKELERLRRENLRQRLEIERRAERALSPSPFSNSTAASSGTSMNSDATGLTFRTRPDDDEEEIINGEYVV